MSKTGRVPNQLLSKQSLIKRKHKNKTDLVAKIIGPLILLFFPILFIVSIHYIVKQFHNSTNKRSLKVVLSNNIPKEMLHSIHSFLDTNPVHSTKNLVDLTSQIQILTSARSVHMIALDQKTAFLSLVQHKPEAAIQYGKLRLISKEGKVFGEYKDTEHLQLPIIKGLPFDKSISLDKEQAIELSPENRELINEGLLLIRSGLSYNINYKTILYNPDRGFQVWLKDSRIRVEMGRRPFNKKNIKLVKILSNLDKKRITKARIELDYQGKAFVKEYSL